MRIPVGSCPGCIAGEKIYPNGRHVDKAGLWFLCPFVTAELADIPNVELISVHTTRKAAVRAIHASDPFGSIHWIGQVPRELWLALRDVKGE